MLMIAMKSKFRLAACLLIAGGVCVSARAQSIPVDPGASESATAATPSASDSWEKIKDYNYEKRNRFAAALELLVEKCEADLQAANAKLPELPYAVAQERQAAMKKFVEACAYLKSELVDLRTVTADTWADAKAKVVESWQQVQAAYGKVKSGPAA